MKILERDLLTRANFLTMISISLFYCCEKVFTHMNIWMIEKISMKHQCLKNKNFTALQLPNHGRYY